MNGDLKVKDIELLNGIVYENTLDKQESLPQWYKKIRRKKLSQLSDGDLARFIRQGMYLDYIIHECINRLYKNLFIGEKYDCEVIITLSNYVDYSFWKEKQECKKRMTCFLNHFKTNVSIESYNELDEFEKIEILESIRRLSKNII